MKEFIAVIKYCRNKEITEYKNKSYVISNTFKCYRKFTVLYDDTNYEFGVACEYLEMKFYIIKKDSVSLGDTPYYYSISEIVNILYNQNEIEIIKKILNQKRNINHQLKYDGVSFNFSFYNLNKYIKKISKETIQLIILISLIQDKSNIYFGKNKEYHEGIIRLIYVLLCRKESHELLSIKGWTFLNNKFYLNNPNQIDCIIIKFDSINNQWIEDFKGKIKQINDKFKLIELFYKLYSDLNNLKLSYEESLKNNIFKVDLIELKNKYRKIYNSLIKLNDVDVNYENSFTKDPVYIGSNIHFLLRINSYEKNKYYLTNEEKKDIMER